MTEMTQFGDQRALRCTIDDLSGGERAYLQRALPKVAATSWTAIASATQGIRHTIGEALKQQLIAGQNEGASHWYRLSGKLEPTVRAAVFEATAGLLEAVARSTPPIAQETNISALETSALYLMRGAGTGELAYGNTDLGRYLQGYTRDIFYDVLDRYQRGFNLRPTMVAPIVEGIRAVAAFRDSQSPEFRFVMDGAISYGVIQGLREAIEGTPVATEWEAIRTATLEAPLHCMNLLGNLQYFDFTPSSLPTRTLPLLARIAARALEGVAKDCAICPGLSKLDPSNTRYVHGVPGALKLLGDAIGFDFGKGNFISGAFLDALRGVH